VAGAGTVTGGVHGEHGPGSGEQVNFNAMGRPASVLVSGGAVRLSRRRETLDDITARDISAAPTGNS